MAPALTKLTKDGHGIHLSSPPVLNSRNTDTEGIMLSMELDPQSKLMDDSFSQKVWLNLSSLPFLDTCCCSKSLFEFPDSLLAPLLQASAGQYKTVLLSNPGSLLSLLSPNKNPKVSPAAAYPGAQDMCFVPYPEHNSQDVALQRQHSGTGADVPRPPPPCRGETTSRYGSAPPTSPVSRLAGGVRGGADRGPAGVWVAAGASDGTVTAEAVAREAGVRERTRWHVSRQAALLGRAGRIQRRLQVLLGEHSSRHCALQLDALRDKLGRTGGTETLSSPAETKPGPRPAHGQVPAPGGDVRPSALANTVTPTELREFVRRAEAALGGVQRVIDSDVTESSSDEDPEPGERWGNRPVPIRAGGEGRWERERAEQERAWLERAELASRWTWLQLRVAELEGRILQLGDLHRQISATKGGVVLAESQPLTDRQIQQTLLTETAGLAFAAGGGGGGGGGELPSDTENEPSSPARLLRNIERQSAQLTQIVNSLMPPLNLSPSSSPVSKDSYRWKGLNKRVLGSGLRGEDALLHRGSKRKRVCRRRQLLQASCVSARTRPLVTYHKPRLFTMNALNTAHSQQDLDASCSSSFSSSSSSCPACESCDPLAVCADPACSGYAPPTGRGLSRPRPAPSDAPLGQKLRTALLREEWVQRPLPVKTEPPSPVRRRHGYRGRRLSSTPLHGTSHGRKHGGRRWRGGARGMSPTRWAGPARTPHGRGCRGGRKRRRARGMMGDEEDFLCELSSPEDSSEEGLEETCTPQASYARKQQGPIRRRQGESIYNIDNIVIPMSLAATTKLEKLHYKDIITPSWRLVDVPPLEEREEEEEEGEEEEQEAELLCDEAFSQRHLGCERREKLRWASWERSRRHRHATRSVGRSLDTSDGAGGSASSWDCGVRSGVTPPPLDRSCGQPETDMEGGALEELVPQAPWEQRAFPLGEEEEEALRRDEEGKAEEAESPRPEGERTGAEPSSAHDENSSSSSSAPSHLSSSVSTPPPTGHEGEPHPRG